MVAFNSFGVLFLAALSLTAVQAQSNATVGTAINSLPLPRAMAHHDHELPNKLWDALSNGFCTVYADFYVEENGNLLLPENGTLAASRQTNYTVQKSYFDPLAKLVTANNGTVYKGSKVLGICETITFYADILNSTAYSMTLNVNKTFDVFHAVLEQYQKKYPGMFVEYSDEGVTPGAINVIFAGTKPLPPYIASMASRLGYLSGALTWLKDYAEYDNTVWGLLSTRVTGTATAVLGTRASLRNLTASDIKTCQEVAHMAHEQGRIVRYTQAFPDEDVPAVWATLVELGSDLVGTTVYGRFREWSLGEAAKYGFPTKPTEAVSTASTGRRMLSL